MIIYNGYFYFDEDKDMYKIVSNNKWDIVLLNDLLLSYRAIIKEVKDLFPFIDIYNQYGQISFNSRKVHVNIRKLDLAFNGSNNLLHQISSANGLIDYLSMHGIDPKGLPSAFGKTRVIYDFSWLIKDIRKSHIPRIFDVEKNTISINLSNLNPFMETAYYKITLPSKTKPLLLATPKLKT